MEKDLQVKKSYLELFCILLSIINMLFMHYYIFFNHYMEDVLLAYEFCNNLLMTIFDVIVILLLSLLLTAGRIKQSLLFSYITTVIWSFLNVFYVRFFNQYIPISIMSQAGNLTDQAVLQSMLFGFQWVDFYFLLSIVLFICAYRRLKVRRVGRCYLLQLFLISVLTLSGTFVVYTLYHFLKSDIRRNMHLYSSKMKGLLFSGSRNAFPNKTRFVIGSSRVICGELFDVFDSVELTEQQIKNIENEYKNLYQRVTTHEVNPNIKNVVYIVLESFLSSSVDLKVDGKEITPFMNALKRQKDVYYNGHVVSNITMGESGDGQFIYMTGILPLRDKLTVGEAKSACFPSLPRLIAKKFGTLYTEIVIPSPPRVWEQEQMNKVYGINKMYCNSDVLGDVVDYLNDEQLFTLAMNSTMYLHQPFFSMVLNYSTHQPYRAPIDNNFILKNDSLPNTYKNYLVACHYADSWLKKYLNHLVRKGVYDNSLIVITADHHAHLDALGMKNKLSKDLPLFIIHGNIDKDIAWQGSMNQLDVYTTLLDILGIESEWHGLGHTILLSNYYNSVTDSAWLFSEQIIKGRFFDIKHQ